MKKISGITINGLKNNKLTKKIPEFYELKKVIENSDWHNKSHVFNHTISVLKNMERLFGEYDKKLSKYLGKKLNKYSRKELLFLSALLHDISKTETLVKKRNITYFPGHEFKGAVKAGKILKRFDLTPKEQKFVIRLVKYHGLGHQMPKMGQSAYEKFRNSRKDIFLELVLLVMADMLGSHLKTNRPKDFGVRLKFYKRILSKY